MADAKKRAPRSRKPKQKKMTVKQLNQKDLGAKGPESRRVQKSREVEIEANPRATAALNEELGWKAYLSSQFRMKVSTITAATSKKKVEVSPRRFRRSVDWGGKNLHVYIDYNRKRVEFCGFGMEKYNYEVT